MTAPPSALTWDTAAQRNRKLIHWRRAVLTRFDKRAIAVAWVLADLFNAKTGFAFPTNDYLVKETGLRFNKVQMALAELESDGAIIRVTKVRPGGQKQRVIYPAAALIPTPAVGVRGDPPAKGVHNLNSRRPRMPKTELERARLAASLREDSHRRARGEHGPTDEELEDAATTKY